VVWEAFQRVKANKGAAGVDDQSIADFEQDRDKNLYRIWNRLSSGSYFPPPVKAVEIPKAGGKGVRVLGVPTVADRVAQTVTRMYLEPSVEPVFHPDSYGYRPKRSALDAVGTCRQRCWRSDWVIDMDIRAFFDTVPWDLVLRAVAHHTDQRWILLYVQRWLQAPLQLADGTLVVRDRGTPQGSAITPPTQWGTCAIVTLRVGGCGVVPAAGGVLANRDAVPDGDLFWADEDVLDEQPHDALASADVAGGGGGAQAGQEGVQVVGEFEVGLLVGGLGVQGLQLAAQAGLAGA
jgi:hypothetical protein